MERPYVDEFMVHSYETDMNAIVSIQNIVKYFMETAIDHTSAVGYGIERLAKEKRGWVVLNWIIKINNFPKFNDKLKVSTWAKKGNTLQATRYFTMEDQNGAVLSKAASRWAFLDLEKRHPVRFTSEMEEAFSCDKEEPFEAGNYALPKENEENIFSEKSLIVRRSETDTNGHANNIFYVEWAVNEVPDDIYINFRIEEIRVLYRKECRYGDKVTVKTYIKEDNHNKNIITSINDKDGKQLCKIATVWCQNH